MDAVSDRIGLVNGANRLYTMDGQLIKSLEELENDKPVKPCRLSRSVELNKTNAKSTSKHAKQSISNKEINEQSQQSDNVNLKPSHKKEGSKSILALNRDDTSIESKKTNERSNRVLKPTKIASTANNANNMQGILSTKKSQFLLIEAKN
ncbi:unnamed protein product [Dracunculus medinensis]|uniref:Doublecortin domain-containing protein n=1 Tax=Dracunculus medinensis TaxID=318479 RepID=A0A0N4UI56_DRAME|nr:unnamed protein product [Dracunculus medinensis]